MSDGISNEFKPIETEEALKIAFTGVILLDSDCDIGTKLEWNVITGKGSCSSDLGYIPDWYATKEEFADEIKSRWDHEWYYRHTT